MTEATLAMSWPEYGGEATQSIGRKLVIQLQAAYATVMDDRVTNFELWNRTRAQVRHHVLAHLERIGADMPPIYRDLWLKRLAPAMPLMDANNHVELVEAFFTDYAPTLREQIQYRMTTDGNVHLAFAGPPGLGKSSCAIFLADWTKTIPRGHLGDYLSIDVSDLPGKIHGKKRGDTVIQDEYLQAYGDGARTAQAMFDNLEDTLRKSGVNLFRLSPRKQESATMQGELEAVAWNRDGHFSLFMCWAGDKPMGIVLVPWCAKDLYDEYEPWKDQNIDRTMAGQFKDHRVTAQRANALCSDERFIQFMEKLVNKPRLKDFRAAVEYFPAAMMSGREGDRVADFLHDICYGWERFKDEYEAWFGVEPVPGLERIAKKCYNE